MSAEGHGHSGSPTLRCRTLAGHNQVRARSGALESDGIVNLMPSIRRATTDAALVRTDYSDQPAWESVVDNALAETEDGFRAYVEVIDDQTLQALDSAGVRAALPGGYEHSFVIIADHVSMTAPEHPLLVLDLVDEPGRAFRAVPATIQAIDNNLAIANMFFSEFADNVDPDGIFRDFPPPP